MSMNNIRFNLSHKGKKWYAIIYYYDPETGDRKQKWEPLDVAYPGNKREAEKALNVKKQYYTLRTGHRINMDLLLIELIPLWLDSLNVRPNTLEHYRLNAKKITTYYQHSKIKVIDYTRADAKQFFNHMLKKGKINPLTGEKEPLAPKTVKDLKNVLYGSFEFAIDCGIIQYNPIQGIKIKYPEGTAKKEPECMTIEELKQFIELLKSKNINPITKQPEGDILTDVVIACANFGLRRSEVLGLREQDLDFENHCIHICNTVTYTTSIHIEEMTKNDSSRRMIMLTPSEEQFFRDVLKKKARYKREYPAYKDNDFVFSRFDGEIINPQFVYKHLKIMFREFGRPGMTVHGLRHSYCTAQINENNVNLEDTQRLLGHVLGSDATQIYNHKQQQQLTAHPLGLL